jgi:Universal stress protein family.
MRILIPTDFSDYSEAALQMASEIPNVTEAIILHVTEGKANGKVKEKLEEARLLLSSQGITTQIRIVEQIKEPIEATIRSVAEEERIDCIIVGARGRGKLENSSWDRYQTTSSSM